MPMACYNLEEGARIGTNKLSQHLILGWIVGLPCLLTLLTPSIAILDAYAFSGSALSPTKRPQLIAKGKISLDPSAISKDGDLGLEWMVDNSSDGSSTTEDDGFERDCCFSADHDRAGKAKEGDSYEDIPLGLQRRTDANEDAPLGYLQ